MAARRKSGIVKRDDHGRFVPGCSGNPAGRPAITKEVREAAAHHTLAAVELLAKVLHDPDSPLPARFLAARELLKTAGVGPVRAGERQHEIDALAELSDDEIERMLDEKG